MTVTAAAGGRNGHRRSRRQGHDHAVRIDPSIVADPKDLEMLEDLVLVAVREAQQKAAELAKGGDGEAHRRPESSLQASVLAWQRSTTWPASWPSCPESGERQRSGSRTISSNSRRSKPSGSLTLFRPWPSKVRPCPHCFNLTEEDLCAICRDARTGHGESSAQ